MDEIKKKYRLCWLFIGIFGLTGAIFVSLYKKSYHKVYLIIAIIAMFITMGLLILQKVIFHAMVRVEREKDF